MKVKTLKKFLEQFTDDQEVLILDEARLGHDDAIHDPGLEFGYTDECGEDVRLEKSDDDDCPDDEEEDDDFQGDLTIPCCLLTFWK
jgi:hypothetical protein